MQFGKFDSFSSFIESYKTEQNKNLSSEISKLSREDQPEFLKKIKDRNVVEVNSLLTNHMPDEPGAGSEMHYHLLIQLKSIIQGDIDIDEDLQRCLNTHENVFVAIRYGDGQGITEPIQGGLDEGSETHIRGEWITKENAYSHGGEKMSVLHFTHHPIGFICTPDKCYQ